MLEGCRHGAVAHLVYASSSSVYGANSALPFSEDQRTDHPVSLYAATKRANELMAHSYSHLFPIPATGLRFFTVYGPWGRPDMSPFLRARIMAGQPIKVFNYGRMRRDFTYIDDIVEGVVRTLAMPAAADPEQAYGMPSTTSAITRQSGSRSTSTRWRRRWAGPQSRTTSRCNRAMSLPRTPIPNGSKPSPALRPQRRWPRGSRDL